MTCLALRVCIEGAGEAAPPHTQPREGAELGKCQSAAPCTEPHTGKPGLLHLPGHLLGLLIPRPSHGSSCEVPHRLLPVRACCRGLRRKVSPCHHLCRTTMPSMPFPLGDVVSLQMT